MSTDDAGGHLSNEDLNALLDGDGDGATQHLDVCHACADRFKYMHAARELVARPVPPLSEEKRAELVANALAAANGDQTNAADADRARRRGIRSPLYARAAAVALIAAAAGGVVAAVRASSHSASSSASSAGPGIAGGHGAASTTTAPPGNTQSNGSPAEAQAADVPTSQPLADAPLQMRPVLRVGAAECPNPGVPLPDTEVEIPLLAGGVGGNANCLRLGPVIVAGWRPTRLTLGPGYVLIDVTPGAEVALARAGLAEFSGAAPAVGITVPAVARWKVVALDGNRVLGDVMGVYDAGPSRKALVLGVDRTLAEQLQAQLAS